MSEVWAILRRGINHETMVTTINTQAFHIEMAPAVSALPCEAKRRLDSVLALAGRYAR
jgi:hypothetical protein